MLSCPPPSRVQITTGYNLEDDRCECVALQDFRAGEQVGSVRDPQLTLCEICV